MRAWVGSFKEQTHFVACLAYEVTEPCGLHSRRVADLRTPGNARHGGELKDLVDRLSIS
jgi:hypothetical protein